MHYIRAHAQIVNASSAEAIHKWPPQHHSCTRATERTSQMSAMRAKRSRGVGAGNPTWKQTVGVPEVAPPVLLEPSAEVSIMLYSDATVSSAKCMRVNQAVSASVSKQN